MLQLGDDCMVCDRVCARDMYRVHMYEPWGAWCGGCVAFVAVCQGCQVRLRRHGGVELVRAF